MPESKRWIDPEIIQRNFERNEAARAAEDDRRRAVAVEGNKRMVSALNKQVAERTARDAEAKASDDAHSAAYLATAGAEQARCGDDRRKRLQLKLQVRTGLAGSHLVGCPCSSLRAAPYDVCVQIRTLPTHQPARLLLAEAADGRIVSRSRNCFRPAAATAVQAKLELEAQMRENARRRREAPMSDIEQAVNRPLLADVDKYEATQALKLKPYPAEFLPKDLQVVQGKLNEQHARAKLKSARGIISSSSTRA